MPIGGAGRRIGSGLARLDGLRALSTRVIEKEWFFGQTFPIVPYDMEIHFGDDPYYAAHLIQLGGGVVHYWTDAPIDLVYGGNTFLHSSPFSVGDIVTSVDGEQLVMVTFDEQSQIIQGYDLNEGMRDRPITIWEARIDSIDKTTVRSVKIVAGPGTTEGIDFDEQGLNSTAVMAVRPSYGGISSTGPRNHHQLDCINTWKDARCNDLSGIVAPCDHTYSDCTSRTNTPHFRGCRYAANPGKTINWGGGDGVTLQPSNRTMYPLGPPIDMGGGNIVRFDPVTGQMVRG